ncbi:3-oxoacyl-ACP reductase FabG [Crocinitomix catalasitica]|uniref:3-oxoacyl-ACP reductase FabG n=1 Tax=Crocinitomix catalasitica TaxID=184607 RepID=UPI00048428F9|nr:3-oxoacyl-ACP reductase FabG [Crocinitomix catalasitica]
MKCALVTGGSRGIGREIAITIAKDHNYHVLVNYASNSAAADETVRLIKENGGSAEPLPFRVENKEAVTTALNKWHENNPESIIEVIINNAGITKDGLFALMEEEAWDSVVDISLKGFYNVTQSLMQKLLRHRYGRIVNIVSLSGTKGNPGQVNYSAAKGGMIAATKALGQEIAKRKITVNAVAPGFITTDMTKDLPVDDLKKLVPANRFGEAQEVADLVSFLVSDKAGYITGEIININGGLYS